RGPDPPRLRWDSERGGMLMTLSYLRTSVRRPSSLSPREHRPTGRPKRFRPLLEGLEQRALLATVTNLSDDGPGSLREAIAIAPAGDTVVFEPGLSGTITLTTGQLTIDKSLTIAGPGADVLTVSGDDASRVFLIDGSTVAISGLTIADGRAVGDSG